jgi:hypothetical protein
MAERTAIDYLFHVGLDFVDMNLFVLRLDVHERDVSFRVLWPVSSKVVGAVKPCS